MDKSDALNVLIYGIIPFLSVAVFFVKNRKLLWAAPLISTLLAFPVYAIILEPSIIKIFSNNEWRGFLLLALLMQFGIAVVLTLGGYLMAHILKRKSNK